MKSYTTVSIVIPACNENNTIREVVQRATRANVLGLHKEIILVDNCSTDGTRDIIQELAKAPNVTAIFHKKNEGVGSSWRDGIAISRGEIIIRQDADMEYRPEDFPVLLEPILRGKAMIVYGSRILGFAESKYKYKSYLWGGLLINKMFNLILGTNLTDALTASKAFDRDILTHFSLESKHFEIEAELTAKVTRAGFQILEVPIVYRARSFEEGKKIRWYHALVIVTTLIRNRFRR